MSSTEVMLLVFILIELSWIIVNQFITMRNYRTYASDNDKLRDHIRELDIEIRTERSVAESYREALMKKRSFSGIKITAAGIEWFDEEKAPTTEENVE